MRNARAKVLQLQMRSCYEVDSYKRFHYFSYLVENDCVNLLDSSIILMAYQDNIIFPNFQWHQFVRYLSFDGILLEKQESFSFTSLVISEVPIALFFRLYLIQLEDGCRWIDWSELCVLNVSKIPLSR